jgi:hypothetical protein
LRQGRQSAQGPVRGRGQAPVPRRGIFAQTTLTFRALAANDPELAPVAPAATVAAPKPMTTDELQAELTKLDDLRKKGLLTDAEFDALKQKILSRF